MKNFLRYKPTTKAFNKSYRHVFDQGEAVNYTIHSFAQVGLHDPYFAENTGEAFAVPEQITDLVYHESRYIRGLSPSCIFIPSRKVLFKIMRACVLANGDEEELWFNKTSSCNTL